MNFVNLPLYQNVCFILEKQNVGLVNLGMNHDTDVSSYNK